MYISIPILNPINIVDNNRVLIPNYNFKHFDPWKSNEQILQYETKKCYHQKWQIDDILYLQFEADFSPIRLQVRDYKGLVVLSQEMSILATIGTKYYFEASIAFDSFNEGVYTLDVLGGDPVLITLVSEPFEIKEEWPGTLLVKYQNSFNNNILWETGIYMLFRVDGVIPYEQPVSHRTVYIDQPGAAQTVKGDAARKFKLYIGCDGGFPPWVIDKMDEIIDQNIVEYDGKGFAPVPGADWNTKKIERYPWAQWNIEMRETVNRRAKIFEITGLQGKKLVQEVFVEGKLFGPSYGQANDNTYTINTIS